jgi:hypothetical protein
MTTTTTNVGTQVYRVYIKATPQAIWDAITSAEWTAKYGYGGRAEWDPELKPGATYRGLASDAMRSMGAPEVAVDGEVIEATPPYGSSRPGGCSWTTLDGCRGVHPTHVQVAEGKGGVSKLTVMHELEGKPQLTLLLSGGLEDMGAGGGWSWVLSDLKTLLETGASMDPHDELNQG